jgi:hypothetical protein
LLASSFAPITYTNKALSNATVNRLYNSNSDSNVNDSTIPFNIFASSSRDDLPEGFALVNGIGGSNVTDSNLPANASKFMYVKLSNWLVQPDFLEVTGKTYSAAEKQLISNNMVTLMKRVEDEVMGPGGDYSQFEGKKSKRFKT